MRCRYNTVISFPRTRPSNTLYISNKNRCGVFLVNSWWRHQIETFSALLAVFEGNSPVTGEFPTQRPVTRSFNVFFDLCLNKRLSKQSCGWWFETLSHSLWRHCNVKVWSMFCLCFKCCMRYRVILDWVMKWSIFSNHHNAVIMNAMASQIASVTIVYSTVCSGADQRKYQSSVSLTFMRVIHRWLVNSPHKGPVTRKCFHFMMSSCVAKVNVLGTYWHYR